MPWTCLSLRQEHSLVDRVSMLRPQPSGTRFHHIFAHHASVVDILGLGCKPISSHRLMNTSENCCWRAYFLNIILHFSLLNGQADYVKLWLCCSWSVTGHTDWGLSWQRPSSWGWQNLASMETVKQWPFLDWPRLKCDSLLSYTRISCIR